MAITIGSGEHTYTPHENWAALPDGWIFGDVAAVGTDSRDRVYCFNRGPHPMIVLDREGNFLNSWGEDIFSRAHGVHMAPDDGDQTVRHCTLDGKVLLEIGVPGKPAPYMSGIPFNRCTHTALSPGGDLCII